MEAIPDQKHYNLSHYQQRFNWDCGISCIIMILSTSQRETLLHDFDKICAEEGFGSSTWTIDLCYLLQRFQVRHEYYTKTLGIDPSYSEHSYYTKIIDKDEKRVTRKFKEAHVHGLHVEHRTIEMEELLQHLGRRGPVILLTNASLLTCEVCKRNVLEKFGYAGHYVVLCGYDLKSQLIYYHNPEVHDEHVCRCTTAAMDVARKAYGTDEDVILIFRN
ncbi:protein GUCD1 isoform X2 [Anastrepha obliqua]|uniref:protein GUCD1 isoform X2 n=1 Tax=Anastrepha ludens TaxID=28586 RepID=UPI0023B1D6A1|nr:protein GUCD1 isoform X2 [Anastrepha ludens]XP_054728135.1 protein GUCD1 isoform X2 [Anastrepha obliqua]